MNKFKIILLLLLVKMTAFSQAVQSFPYKENSMPWSLNIGDSVIKRTFPGASLELGDSLSSKKGLLNARGSTADIIALTPGLQMYDIIHKTLAIRNDTGWIYLGAGGGATDISGKLNISDTAAMLIPYLRKIDTAAMLQPYLRDIDTTGKWLTSVYRKTGSDSIFYYKGGLSIFGYKDSIGVTDISGKLNISDTAAMLLPYLRKLDTAAMLQPYLRDIDTTGKWLTSLFRKQGSDSIFYYKGGVSIFGYKDSIGVTDISGKLNISDSTIYYPYWSNPRGYINSADISGKLNITDTAAAFAAHNLTASMSVQRQLNNLTLVNDSPTLVLPKVYGSYGIKGWLNAIVYEPVDELPGDHIITPGPGLPWTNIHTAASYTDGLAAPGMCPVTWVSGLTFHVGIPCSYFIGGVPYNYAGGDVILPNADPTDPRQDAIVVNTAMLATSVQGTAQSNPEVPTVSSTELFLTSVFVGAGATTPINVGQHIVRDEAAGGEWSITKTLTSNDAYGTNPFSGSISQRITAASNNQYIYWSNPAGLINSSDYDYVILEIRNNATMNANRTWRIAIYNNGTQIGNTVSLEAWGHSRTILNQYRRVAVPFSAFNGGGPFNRIRITNVGTGGTVDIQIDKIELQTNLITIPSTQPAIITVTADDASSFTAINPLGAISILGTNGVTTSISGNAVTIDGFGVLPLLSASNGLSYDAGSGSFTLGGSLNFGTEIDGADNLMTWTNTKFLIRQGSTDNDGDVMSTLRVATPGTGILFSTIFNVSDQIYASGFSSGANQALISSGQNQPFNRSNEIKMDSVSTTFRRNNSDDGEDLPLDIVFYGNGLNVSFFGLPVSSSSSDSVMVVGSDGRTYLRAQDDIAGGGGGGGGGWPLTGSFALTGGVIADLDGNTFSIGDGGSNDVTISEGSIIMRYNDGTTHTRLQADAGKILLRSESEDESVNNQMVVDQDGFLVTLTDSKIFKVGAGASFSQMSNSGFFALMDDGVFEKSSINIQSGGATLQWTNNAEDETGQVLVDAAGITLSIEGPTQTITAYGGMRLNTTTQAFTPPRMTATQGSALTPGQGDMIFVTDTNGTFTAIGWWGYNGSAWVQL